MSKEWKLFRDAPEDKQLLWWVPASPINCTSYFWAENKAYMHNLKTRYEMDGMRINLEDWVWKHLPPPPKTKKDNR